jgi:hypothetical protein
VEQNDDSLASGSFYHHRDDAVDNDKGSADVNVAPGDSNSIKSVFGRGGDQGCGRGRVRGRGRGCGQGRGRGRGRGASVPKEEYTGMKVAFPPDTSWWPEYQRLSDRIHNMSV